MKDAIPLIVWALLASTNALGSHTTDFRNPMDRDFDYTVVPRSYEPKNRKHRKNLANCAVVTQPTVITKNGMGAYHPPKL